MKKTTKKLIIKKETVSEFANLSKKEMEGVVGGKSNVRTCLSCGMEVCNIKY